MSIEDRFWPKVDRRGDDECWPWTAARNEHGYGVLRPDGRRHGPSVRAHRIAAQLAGMDIDGRPLSAIVNRKSWRHVDAVPPPLGAACIGAALDLAPDDAATVAPALKEVP